MEIPAVPPQAALSAIITPIPEDSIDSTFSHTTNLASSALNARVLSCSNDYFASVDNLLNPAAPIHRPGVFIHTGAWYDGWETRRHNPAPYDWAVIKLGVSSGVVAGVEIDTAFFKGNFGEKVLVEGTHAAASDDDEDKKVANPEYDGWKTILPIQPCGPSKRQAWLLSDKSDPITHVRVRMYPDGGFARLRLYGHVIPPSPAAAAAAGSGSDDSTLAPLEELSSALLGGLALSASDQHYTPCSNIILPGRGKDMGDGWETARSRTPNHVDWAIIKLGLSGSIEKVVVDTKDFRGNFPRTVRVHGFLKSPEGGSEGKREPPAFDNPSWLDLLDGEHPCSADTEHVFQGEQLLTGAKEGKVYSYVKLTLIPDGGVKRLRIFGRRH